jgi:hypothetical protein
VDNAERHFLGHNLGRRCYVPSTLDRVADAGPNGEGLYTIRTALPPVARSLGWASRRLEVINGAYLQRRKQSALQEEDDYGLSVDLLAIGAAFVYDSQRLADALRH